MSDFQLFALDEAGETAHSEVLRGVERGDLRALADQRLTRWHSVEIWEGPMCLVRVRRSPVDAA